MNDWLSDSLAALAAEAGVDASDLTLPDADAKALLDIARIASHTSGERINAPLLTYLIGRLAERAPGTSLADLKALVASRSGVQD